jgi:hypothetical protein
MSLATLFVLAAQLLFDNGVKDVENGRLERARLTLQTLVNTYPSDALTPAAREQIQAIQLFEEGQERMRQGRYAAAEFTFQTMVSVYPESPLVKQAQEAMRAAAKAQQDLVVKLMVRKVDLKDLGMSEGDVQKCFAEREVPLAAGRVFDPRAVEQARMALTELAGAPIRAEARMAGEHEVDVVLSRVQ